MAIDAKKDKNCYSQYCSIFNYNLKLFGGNLHETYASVDDDFHGATDGTPIY